MVAASTTAGLRISRTAAGSFERRRPGDERLVSQRAAFVLYPLLLAVVLAVAGGSTVVPPESVGSCVSCLELELLNDYASFVPAAIPVEPKPLAAESVSRLTKQVCPAPVCGATTVSQWPPCRAPGSGLSARARGAELSRGGKVDD